MVECVKICLASAVSQKTSLLFSNNCQMSTNFNKMVVNILRKQATNVYNFVHLALTTLPCEICTSYSSSLQHTCAPRCSHSEWQKHFLARYIRKVIINLLNISFTEVVTASHLKHCWWSLNLSAGQCTSSSIMHIKQWSCFVVINPNSLLHISRGQPSPYPNRDVGLADP